VGPHCLHGRPRAAMQPAASCAQLRACSDIIRGAVSEGGREEGGGISPEVLNRTPAELQRRYRSAGESSAR
jgi:hypothetical protein